MGRGYLNSLLLSTAGALALTASAQAGALPSHGHFVSGQGSIGKGNQSLIVKQSSTTGIINWNSFSVGKHEGVTFDNGHGATLSRVTGGNLSHIAGSLSATGSLYLMNSSGVIVSGSGHIVTGGSFIATSASLSDTAFNDGQRRFGNADARIINRGSIIAGGEAKLVGSNVTNTGTITGAHMKLRATDGAVLAGGSLRATGDADQNARILVISDTGETKVTGSLTASNRNGSGGLIETSGHHVAIGGSINTGNGGTWLVDPENLTVDSSAATTIDNALNAGTDVALQTTQTGTSGPGTSSSGRGNIIIDAPLSWNTAASLTLDAYHSVVVHASISAAIQTAISVTATHGVLSFKGGNISLADLTSTLTIDGKKYRLVGNIATLARDIALHSAGHFALANSYNAANDRLYKSSPIHAAFSGTFEGLGNEISNLRFGKLDLSKGSDVGLFGQLSQGGIIRNLSLTNVSMSIPDFGSSFFLTAGALVGMNDGTIKDVSVTGAVMSEGANSIIGLVVGSNNGTLSGIDVAGKLSGMFGEGGGLVGASGSTGEIKDVTADTTVKTSGAFGFSGGEQSLGGLVGDNNGKVIDSSASGNVIGGEDVGGLVGNNNGAISGSHATGTVSGTKSEGEGIGGFAGWNTGTIETSFATGNVSQKAGSAAGVGGFVGYNEFGSIDLSYATGNVSATTPGGGLYVGGFAGVDDAAGIIKNAYATGDVSGKGSSTSAGGFLGNLGGDTGDGGYALVKDSYSTGTVSIGEFSSSGGFASVSAPSGPKIVDCYWDVTTSGITDPDGFGKGLTTQQLQAVLPKGFSAKDWAIDPKINNGLPYLVALRSSY